MQLQKSLRTCTLLLVFLLCKGFLLQAQTIQYNRADSIMADSLLSLAFQNEALYSLHGPLKSISTVAQFSMELDSITDLPLDSADFYRFIQLQKVGNWLSDGRFVYAIPENGEPRTEDLDIRLEAERVLNRFIAEFEPFKMQNPDLPFLKWYILALKAENEKFPYSY